MFLCDVDMVFNEHTIERVRFNTGHRQVYAPVFFSEYGPMFARHGGITEDNGYWRVYSYGMMSIRNHDYRATPGFELGFEGWGLEDLRFAETVIKAKYAFVRAFEPALYHPFHTKYCGGVKNEQYKDCLPTKLTHLGAVNRLGYEYAKRLDPEYAKHLEEQKQQKKSKLIHF